MAEPLLLAVETSTRACSVALGGGGRVFQRHREVERTHAALLLPMIDAVLDEAGVKLAGLDAIVYGAGPGSFTGVRLAVAVAQGLGFAAGLPLVAVSSLAAVAEPILRSRPEATVVVAQDARMGEIYTATCRYADGRAIAAVEDRLIAPETLEIGDDELLAGDAWSRIAVLRERAGDRQALATLPRAESMLAAGAAALAGGTATDAAGARPRYLRNTVVRTP
ncbi:MAG: tRNA (adenosine(37)-N6)-threonylcarbamoyltransferase complex dimerization subunit type 1 TsaB [Pseudomonadota bacterium]